MTSALVFGLPRLHQLVRPSIDKSEPLILRTVFPYGDGSEALAVRVWDERLSIFHLPSVTLRHRLNVPGDLLGFDVGVTSDCSNSIYYNTHTFRNN